MDCHERIEAVFVFPEHFNQGLYRKKDFLLKEHLSEENINLARVRRQYIGIIARSIP